MESARQKKIAMINDLSGYGRCSLTVAIPVISAMKVQCCPVPTSKMCIRDRVYRIQRETGERVSNVVVMGSGEPMDNYDNLVRFIRLLTDENGLNISQRNVTVSTCGLIPGIRRLADEGLPVTLTPVSYTHLDVYKRQTWRSSGMCWRRESR